MLSPCFIPDSIFYTQAVMLSPRFIPEPLFYDLLYPVRSPQSVFYTDLPLSPFWKQGIDYRCPSGILNYVLKESIVHSSREVGSIPIFSRK